MKNIVGNPVVSVINLSVMPVGGTTPSTYTDTLSLTPPAVVETKALEKGISNTLERVPTLPSWRKARQSGAISMNPYNIGRIEDSPYIARVVHNRYLYKVTFMHSADCSKRILNKDVRYHDIHLKYTEQGDLSYWKHVKKLRHYTCNVDYSSQVEHIKTALLAKLNTTYDLLTELAEGKETIQLIAQLLKTLAHPLASFKKGKEALYKSFHRGEIKTYSLLLKKVADLWLTYRYGIMPIIYSIKDVLKLIKLSDNVYHTERSETKVDIKDFEHDPWLKPDMYLHDTISGSIQIRAVGKDRYAKGTELQVSDLIGFNPAVTLWEKIPYSLVVDWAVNVGDYLNALLSSVTSLASERVCVYSVRCNYSIETRLHWDLDESYRAVHPGQTVCTNMEVFPPYDVTRGGQNKGSQLVHIQKVNTFQRVVFNASDIKLAFHLQMNLKRKLDSAAFLINISRRRISALR